jgi:hypothetical protein
VKRKLLVGLIVVFCLALAAAAFAEDREDGQAKPEPQMRKEMVKLKYVRANDAAQLLSAYRSMNGRISVSKDANQNEIIVMSDVPELVDKMLSLIRDIDVKPTEMQFTAQLILGAEAVEDKGDDALKNDPIIRELRGVLKYKTFIALDGTILRVIEGEMAQAKIGPRGEYVLRLSPNFIRDGAAETIKAKIELIRQIWAPMAPNQTNPQMINSELVSTTLMLKPGEKTVVGVSKSDADKGLILIISGKVTK